MINSAQIRAARAMLGWKQTDLAKAASISEMSVKKIEAGSVDPRVSTINSIQAAFEAGGVVFLDAGQSREGGPGVRLK
jgi:predicted transcriptional regulator